MTRSFDTARHAALSRAIARRIGVDMDAAGELALRVLNYFGFEDEAIDNSLDQEDRRLFYFLQDLGLLKTAWEEAMLPSGRIWRIFYWSLNVESIEEYSREVETPKEEEGLYEALPAAVWARDEVRAEGA
jgi:hypothetical protein